MNEVHNEQVLRMKANRLWNEGQRNMWIEIWRNSYYSMKDLMDSNKWVKLNTPHYYHTL